MKSHWREAYRATFGLIKLKKHIWVPFLVLAVAEGFLLGLFWLAPMQPFARFLAPPITFFFSESNLHYPRHLWFLYDVMRHTHVVVSIGLGAMVTGLVCALVAQQCEGKPLSIRNLIVEKRVKYGSVVIVYLCAWLATLLIQRIILFLEIPPSLSGWTGTIAVLMLQLLVVYAILQ